VFGLHYDTTQALLAPYTCLKSIQPLLW